MDIKAIIFDLDGTLLDTIEDIADANNRMLRKFKYPEHPVSSYIYWIGNGATKLVIDSLPKTANFSEDKIYDYLNTYSRFYKKNIANKTKIYKGIENLLDYLGENNIHFAINTNKPEAITHLVFEKLLKSWPFKFVYGENGEFPKKPNPESSLHIAHQLGVMSENILFVGDSEVDLETAKNAGMHFLGVSWGYGNHKLMIEMGCERMVDSPLEIIDFIESYQTT